MDFILNDRMKLSPPFFSVLIPSFNRPDYLRQSINSIFQNNYTDFEIIVADDCSQRIDEIVSVTKKFEGRGNFSFYSHKSNIGWSENRNFLVQKAIGKYVILLGDDDLLFPFSLERIKWNIEKNNADIYSFGYQIINDSGKNMYSIHGLKKRTIEIDKPYLVKKLFNADILPFGLFHPFTLAYKRELGNLIRYNKDVGIGDDYLFLFESVIMHKVILIIPEVLFSWRKTFSVSSANHQNLSSVERNIESRQKIIKVLRAKEIEPEYLRIFVNKPAYYNRFILEPYISHSELWYKKEGMYNLINNEDYKKIKHKLNMFYFTYLKILRTVEKITLLGFYPTYLNVKAYFRRK